MKTTLRLTIAVFGLAILSVSTNTAQAQFNYITNNGTITITGYTGPGGHVTIPDEISGLPVTTIGGAAFNGLYRLTSITIPDSVTNIGNWAFEYCTSLTSITIPDSVTSIGGSAFQHCTSLTNVIIGTSVTSIGGYAFQHCTSLTSLTIPDSVTSIVDWAFSDCTSLTNVIIGTSVTSIGSQAFAGCTSLTGLYFQGNGFYLHVVLVGADNATVYYLPGTTGWDTTFGGRPTAPWLLPYPVTLTTTPNFGVQTNAFGFRISWATNATLVVEASTTLANPVWSPVSTNTLTDGWTYFSDAEWTNYPARFYRVRQW